MRPGQMRRQRLGIKDDVDDAARSTAAELEPEAVVGRRLGASVIILEDQNMVDPRRL